MDIVLLFPGQGSQKPGMGKDLAERFPAAREVFEEADRVLGGSPPLSALCFEGPEGELTSTQNAQPALLAHGAAAWAVVRERLAPFVRAAAGHSLGEFTAYHAAGTLSLADALRLVRRRGALMYESGVTRPGTMAAILGLDAEAVEALCTQAQDEGAGVVVPANYNSQEQLVVSGETAGVERVMALAKAAGAKRAVRLNVSGAFHSPLMAPAVAGLEAALAAASFAPPAFPIYANVTAEAVCEPARARALLLEQLTAPVRWTALVRNLATAYPGALFVELGPGSVLTNLVRRIAPEVATAPGGTAADIEQLLQRIAT
jgi:[acyl-carrier-protein] S-malonyltransferase